MRARAVSAKRARTHSAASKSSRHRPSGAAGTPRGARRTRLHGRHRSPVPTRSESCTRCRSARPSSTPSVVARRALRRNIALGRAAPGADLLVRLGKPILRSSSTVHPALSAALNARTSSRSAVATRSAIRRWNSASSRSVSSRTSVTICRASATARMAPIRASCARCARSSASSTLTVFAMVRAYENHAPRGTPTRRSRRPSRLVARTAIAEGAINDQSVQTEQAIHLARLSGSTSGRLRRPLAHWTCGPRTGRGRCAGPEGGWNE